MTGGNAELAMMALVIIIMVLIFAVVWFVFMAPMEKGLHERRMDLIQAKLRRNEERLRRDGGEELDDGPRRDAADASRD